MMPMHSFAAALTGLPIGKKKTHRGRKSSGKPGSDHLSQLQQAHGQGDFKAAKTHALNYAKAVHRHAGPDLEEMTGGLDGAPDDTGATLQPPPVEPSNRRTALAKLAMGRKK